MTHLTTVRTILKATRRILPLTAICLIANFTLPATAAPKVEQDTKDTASIVEHDATQSLSGRTLKSGITPLDKNASGMQLFVEAKKGEPLRFFMKDAMGRTFALSAKKNSGSGSGSGTTCWQCGLDAAGHKHCWQVPCPIIVGPWRP
jgi:hypothetical protein